MRLPNKAPAEIRSPKAEIPKKAEIRSLNRFGLVSLAISVPELFNVRPIILPLPLGEGWGEGNFCDHMFGRLSLFRISVFAFRVSIFSHEYR